MASARSSYDDSNWCFNCLTLNPCVVSTFTHPALIKPYSPVPQLRNIVREGYHIDGNCCVDVFLGMFCGPCVICQHLNEVEDRGRVTKQMYANRAEVEEPWRFNLCGCFSNCCNCLFGFLLTPCAMAYARSQFDGSSCVFNCLCMNPPLIYSVIRDGYNLEVLADFNCQI